MTRRYIAVTADIFEHHAFADESYSRRDAWLWLIANAAWKPHRVRMGNAMVEVGRGQVVSGRSFLGQKWGWGAKKVRLFLDFLASEGMIKKDASRGRLANVITICNYDAFQTGGAIEGPVRGRFRASCGAPKGPIEGQFGDDENASDNNDIFDPLPDQGPVEGPVQGQLTVAKRATQYQVNNNNPLTPLKGDSAVQDQGSEEKPSPKRRRQRPPSGPKSYPIEFEAVWQSYPKAGRNEKKRAFDAWSKLSDDDKAALPQWIGAMDAKLAADHKRGFDRRPKDMHRWLANSLDDYRDSQDSAENTVIEDPYCHLRGLDDGQWRMLIGLRANGFWMASELGPPPCSKSCIAPRHIIDEMGLSDAYDGSGRATNTHDPRHPIHRHNREAAA